MDSTRNPFTPGAGHRPAFLVGRDSELDAARTMIGRAKLGNPLSRSLMLWGLRGTGKTVLLREMHQLVRDAGWLAVTLEAQHDNDAATATRRRLERELVLSARSLRSRRGAVTETFVSLLRTISSFSLSAGSSGITVSADISPVRGRADSDSLEIDLIELAEYVSRIQDEPH